ncbi:uncharacterized protein LOC111373287 [Olea europaea var. sylvestris]|uniref:uncharacterized protein LOC111373287 n=1 Tax=Olea europaea var. sylvestris TaxID=158386 RepID=UPI000C1CDA06|nr:uncharacterized protein LOC111373287 [Olea europaea var. sylvestris]
MATPTHTMVETREKKSIRHQYNHTRLAFTVKVRHRMAIPLKKSATASLVWRKCSTVSLLRGKCATSSLTTASQQCLSQLPNRGSRVSSASANSLSSKRNKSASPSPRTQLPLFVHHRSHHKLEFTNKPFVRVYSNLTIRDGKVILALSNPSNPFQWVKDEKYSTRVEDEEGFPSFALINKATGQAMKHSIGATHPIVAELNTTEPVDLSS